MCVGKKLDKIEQAQRERRLIEYRTVKGMSDAEIAVIEGYSSVSAANRAVLRALRKLPEPPNIREVRRDNEVTGDYLRRLFTDIAEHPQPQHTSIGRIMWNVTLCDCPNGGISQAREDHAKECAIKPVMDYSTTIRAGEALRKLGESKVTAVRELPEDEAMRRAREWLASLPQLPVMTAEVVPELDPAPDDERQGHADDGQVHD